VRADPAQAGEVGNRSPTEATPDLGCPRPRALGRGQSRRRASHVYLPSLDHRSEPGFLVAQALNIIGVRIRGHQVPGAQLDGAPGGRGRVGASGYAVRDPDANAQSVHTVPPRPGFLAAVLTRSRCRDWCRCGPDRGEHALIQLVVGQRRYLFPDGGLYLVGPPLALFDRAEHRHVLGPPSSFCGDRAPNKRW
jgi:hypothetical protein